MKDSDGMSVISNYVNDKNLKNSNLKNPYIFSKSINSQKNFDDNASINSYSISQSNIVLLVFD